MATGMATGNRRGEAASASARAAPGALLAVAAGIVGVAIALDGTAARSVNGIGVLCWIVASVMIVRALRHATNRLRGTAATAIGVGVLSFVVRPSDLIAALIGFSVAGVLIALIVPDRPVQWALLLPAAWLPAHIAVAIGRSVLADSPSVRTDPPPTTVFVPLAMVLAATLGGYAVARFRTEPGLKRRAARLTTG